MDDNFNNENEVLDNAPEEEQKDKKRKPIIIILFVIIVLVLASVVCIKLFSNKPEPIEESTKATTQEVSVNTDGTTLADNPIDFTKIREGNREIFSWIKVDGTEVDYPICQSSGNDEFYLKHKAEDRSWSASGAIYIEMCNSKQFDDPVTLIYGHNGYGDSMFTTLHRFEKQDFFDSHPYFYIYQQHRKLTYQIVSAFKYDNRHIMNSFDFNDEKIFSDFCSMIQNPTSTTKNVRSELETQINADSNIVVLSTCITNQKSSRYLVCGVLVKDEKTN